MSNDTSKKPDLLAFATVKTKSGRTMYHKIGAAWNVAKGGISIDLFATPVDGQIVLFPPKEAPQDSGEE